jgi:hypothetical protein
MRNDLGEVMEEIETHVSYSVTVFVNRAVNEIKWKNIVEPDRPQMTTWRIRITCCLTKATNTQPEYVTFMLFPLQKGCKNAP